MNQVKVNFINWRPDQDEYSLDGLIEALNTVHSETGYEEVNRTTDTSLATATPSSGAAFDDIQIKTVGVVSNATIGNKIWAYVGATSGTLTVSHQFAATSISFATAISGAGVVKGFQVCELNDNVFVSAHASGTSAGGTSQSANFTGYIPI